MAGTSKWDWATHPGETLIETLEELGWTQVELARRTKLSTKHINQICKGYVGVSPHVAIRLEKATGVSASIWVRLDADYRLSVARRTIRRRR